MNRKLVALVLCVLVFATVLPAQGTLETKAASIEVPVAKQLPKAEDMVIDPINYHRQVIQGYYNFDCFITPDVSRPAKFYIPVATGSSFNRPTVFIVVPEGENPYQFLVKSGWKAISDSDELNIVLAEAGEGGWKSNAEEMIYLDFLRTDVNNKPFFSTYSSSFYAIAYGEKATSILQENSMRNPTNWSAVLLAGTSGVSKDFVAEMQNTPSKIASVSLAEVSQPIWVISNEKSAAVQNLIEYHKVANHSEYVSTKSSFADELYVPRRGGTDDNEWIANVVYSQENWNSLVNVEFARSAYDNMFKGIFRYAGGPNGALRQNDDIYDRGFKRFTALVPGGFMEDGSDKYTREWFVYVPESVDTSKPAPLVFTFPGAGGSGDEIADRTGWAAVADKEGFILICPTGSHITTIKHLRLMTTTEITKVWWNTVNAATEDRPNDLLFVSHLYDWMRANYNIDESRIYASGQSSGGMMTWASLMYLPEIFTAGAPLSADGPRGEINPNPSQDKVGIIAFIGELDNLFKGAFGGPVAKENIEYWTSLYNTVEDWSSYTYLDGGQQASYVTDEFTNYVYHTQNGTPLLRVVEVAGKTHASLPSESFLAWNECFSRYTKDKSTGNLYFDGVLVE